MEIETLFQQCPKLPTYKRVKHPVGLGPEPRRQEPQSLKLEALPFCLGTLKAEGNSEEVPGSGINVEVGKGNLEPG